MGLNCGIGGLAGEKNAKGLLNRGRDQRWRKLLPMEQNMVLNVVKVRRLGQAGLLSPGGPLPFRLLQGLAWRG